MRILRIHSTCFKLFPKLIFTKSCTSHLLSYPICKNFTGRSILSFTWRSRWTLNFNFLFYCVYVIVCFLSSGCRSFFLRIFLFYTIYATQAQRNLLPSQHCLKHCNIYPTLSILRLLSFSNLQPFCRF